MGRILCAVGLAIGVLLSSWGSAFGYTCFAFDPVFLQSDRRLAAEASRVAARPGSRSPKVTVLAFKPHSQRLAEEAAERKDGPQVKFTFQALDEALTVASK